MFFRHLVSLGAVLTYEKKKSKSMWPNRSTTACVVLRLPELTALRDNLFSLRNEISVAEINNNNQYLCVNGYYCLGLIIAIVMF